MHHRRKLVPYLAVLVGLAGCAAQDGVSEDPPAAEEPIVLGPADGHDLSSTDLERVAAGDLAPDFTAMTLAGDALTLSEFRGSKNVVLMFYRGHW